MRCRSARAIVSGIGLVAVVGAGACTGSDEPAARPAPTSPTTSESPPSADDAERSSAEATIRSLDAGSGVGFAPEVLEAVGDQEVLPPSSRVEPVAETWDREEEFATMEVIVHQDDGGGRYGVLMEKRDGEWLVVMTVDLGGEDG